MYNYNFRTRTLSTIFDDVQYLVLSSRIDNLGLPKEAYEIIDYKEFVVMAIKAEYIENFKLNKLYDTGNSGKCTIGKAYFSWSLQQNNTIIFLG